MTHGRVDMPGARGSGVSATVGLVMVVAVLLLAGTLAVSGGGLLSRGGQLGAAPPEGSPAGSPDGAGASGSATGSSATGAPGAQPEPGTSGAPAPAATPIGAVTDYSCDQLAIRDPESSRWTLSRFVAGAREGFDRVTLQLTRTGKSSKATVVRTEWLSPREAAARFDIARPTGGRALVLTLTGQVELRVNQAIDSAQLDAEGVGALRSIQVFTAEADGLTRAVIGIRGDGCVRLESRQWKKKGRDKKADIWVDVQTG